MSTHTPAAWRAAALVVLGGGLASGWVVARSRAGWAAIGATAAALVGATVPILIASRRARPGAWPEARPGAWPEARPGARPGAGPEAPPPGVEASRLPSATVIVAARDEAEVVAGLCTDLGRQDHREPDGRPRFDVIFIDDRSTDQTGDVIRAAADAAGIGTVTRVLRRAGDRLPDGKGAALAEVPPETCSGRAIVVLDADARIGPAFVRRAAAHVAGGTRAATARRRVLPFGTGRLGVEQADEQAVDGLIQLGRWSIGGCSEFRGNGFVIDRDSLIAAGGWGPPTLTEDLDLSSRLAARLGVRVAIVGDLEVWESPVERLGDLWAQRLRWAEGSIRRYVEHGPRVVGNPALAGAARLDFALYGLQHALPPFVVGLVGGGLVHRRLARPAALLAVYGATGVTVAWAALLQETSADGSALDPRVRLSRAARVTAFGAGWVAVVPVALWRLGTRRGPLRFAKTPHRALRGSAA